MSSVDFSGQNISVYGCFYQAALPAIAAVTYEDQVSSPVKSQKGLRWV